MQMYQLPVYGQGGLGVYGFTLGLGFRIAFKAWHDSNDRFVRLAISVRNSKHAATLPEDSAPSPIQTLSWVKDFGRGPVVLGKLAGLRQYRGFA